jgi:hypothetical protein
MHSRQVAMEREASHLPELRRRADALTNKGGSAGKAMEGSLLAGSARTVGAINIDTLALCLILGGRLEDYG